MCFALSWVWWNMSCMSSEIHINVTVSRQRLTELLLVFFREDCLHMHVPQGQLWLFKPVHPGWEAHIPAYPKDKPDVLSRSSPGRKHMFFLPHWQTCSFSGRARVNFRNMSSGKLWNMFKTMCSEMKNRIVEIMFNNIFNMKTYL